MIRIVDDVVSPAVVWGASWAAETADTKSAAGSFKWYRPVGIGLAAVGYVLGGWLGYGGTFVKNLGIASFPWALNSIKSYIEEAGVSSRAPAAMSVARRVSRYPAEPYVKEFSGTRLV